MLEYAQKLLSWRMNHDEQVLTHISLTHDGPVAPRRAIEQRPSCPIFRQTGGPMLSIQNLSHVHPRGVRALDSVS